MKLRISLAALAFGWMATLPASSATLTIAPTTTNNAYAGNLSLLIGGLTSGQTVAVARYLDLNTNGVVDAADPLVQGFSIRDGQLHQVGGATNYNRPRDLDGLINSNISTALSQLDTNNTDHIIGRYLFRVLDSNGAVLATSTYTITNFPYSQMVTGLVKSVTNVPNAGVALLQQSLSGNTHFIAGAIANNAGAYAIKAATNTYLLVGIHNGYVADFSTAPLVTLGAGQTINTNVTLIAATNRTISGRLVEAGNTNQGLAGVQLFIQSTNNLFTIAWTDTNGNFSVPVTPSAWEIEPDDSSVTLKGYVALEGQLRPKVDTTSSNATGILIALPKVVSMFYGTVRDNLGNVVPGIEISGDTDTGYRSRGFTDVNGVYAVAVTATNWFVNPGSDALADKGYIGASGTNYTFGQNESIRVDFTIVAAPYTITGSVKDTNSNPLVDVNVSANANINGTNYNANANTDDNGNFTLRVAGGTWNINLACGDLGSMGFDCSTNQTVTTPPNRSNVNFVVGPIQPLQITTTSLPDATVGNFYSQFLNASGGVQFYNWTISSGSLPGGLTLNSFSGEISGMPGAPGSNSFTVTVTDQRGSNATKNLSIKVQPSGPLQILTTMLPDGVQSCSYPSAQLEATGGAPPYSWGLAFGSAQLPAGLMLANDGTVFGIPTTNGFFSFVARASDSFGASNTATVSININPRVQVDTTSLPDGTSGTAYFANLSASGGAPPQTWSIVSNSLPPNLLLNTNTGAISGTPITPGTYNFTVRVADTCSAVTRALSITIYAPLQITTTTLPFAFVNVPYSAQLQATGGLMPFDWMLDSGSAGLPAGLTISTGGLIAGTPAIAGTNNFIVDVTDFEGQMAMHS
ncbi:MAG TPA: putative Ig domain-containing protein, partial [Verrucomicrobiae bacterium]